MNRYEYENTYCISSHKFMYITGKHSILNNAFYFFIRKSLILFIIQIICDFSYGYL
jgi:hypothetical protein